MRYISTRGEAARKTFREILLEGLASDGGLYVPERYPQLDLEVLRGKDYLEIAYAVMSYFVGDDIPPEDLRKILQGAYSAEAFGCRDITPLTELRPGLSLLGLSEGPTLAFKDIALRGLAAFMAYVLKQNGQRLNILGATSGDTGSAAEDALAGIPNVNVFMLSPKAGMSELQRRQMYTRTDKNIFNIQVDGGFDDCQDLMKEVNGDAAFKARHSIGAVNSVNWVRVALQAVYYVYACTRFPQGTRVSVAVPSGNFGNALAAYVAYRMGAPIGRIYVCTNENDVLATFFRTGLYRRSGEAVLTLSPSMNIQEASNLERFVFDLIGRDGARVRELWAAFKKGEGFSLEQHYKENPLWYLMMAGSASDEEVLDTIASTHHHYEAFVDPHTAVAMRVGTYLHHEDELSGSMHLIVAETAKPAKFPETIRRATDLEPPMPEQFRQMLALPEFATPMGKDVNALKRFIAKHAF